MKPNVKIKQHEEVSDMTRKPTHVILSLPSGHICAVQVSK